MKTFNLCILIFVFVGFGCNPRSDQDKALTAFKKYLDCEKCDLDETKLLTNEFNDIAPILKTYNDSVYFSPLDESVIRYNATKLYEEYLEGFDPKQYPNLKIEGDIKLSDKDRYVDHILLDRLKDKNEKVLQIASFHKDYSKKSQELYNKIALNYEEFKSQKRKYYNPLNFKNRKFDPNGVVVEEGNDEEGLPPIEDEVEEPVINEEAPPPSPPPVVDEVFKVVEEMPRFPGCEKEPNIEERKQCADERMLNYIYSNLKYPAIAKQNGVEGMVVIQFVVDTTGTLADIKVVRDIGAGTANAALDVVSSMNNMPLKWIPGKQRGRKVKVQFTLPVKFKLDE